MTMTTRRKSLLTGNTARPDMEQIMNADMPRSFDNSSHIRKVVPIAIAVHALILAAIWHFFDDFDTRGKRTFLALFFFRYTRLIVNTISWYFAKPWTISSNTPHPSESCIIIPSADPADRKSLGV